MGKASIGTWNKQIEFDPSDPADEKRAWMAAFSMTSERYDEIKESTRKRTEEFNEKYPFLKNLNWVSGEMYYTDDAGNRIDTEVAMKEVSDSLKDTIRKLCKSHPRVEAKIELLQEVIVGDEKFGNINDEFLHYIDPEDFEED